jgi:putative RecB family exonuclease
MPIYSHSQLSTYRQCPLKYKLRYRDRIKRATESIEAYLGTMVHETLKKCYDDARLTKLNSLEELLEYYRQTWEGNWHDSVVINKPDLSAAHYQALGQKMIESYYQRHAPFDADITIATEMRLNFALDDETKYRLVGFIDRLTCAGDGAYEIHDYKSSAYLPAQAEADNDRQLALYQIGLKQRWPDIQDIRLVWHYLAFDKKIVSTRSEEDISRLVSETAHLINEIELAEDFPPQESGLCNWCEYPDLCPLRKHQFTVEALPANQYLKEPGVKLVNRYAELKEQVSQAEAEMNQVREALIEYARREAVTMITGSDHKASVKYHRKLKFPGKNEAGRKELDHTIIAAGKWPEVSHLDTSELVRVIESGLWDRELIDEVAKYGRLEETSAVYLSKLKET